MKKNIYYWIFLLTGAGMLYTCHPGKNKKIDISEPKFSTSEASELFFKNIRQSYYEKTEMKEAKLEVYRIKEGMQKEGPLLRPAIVINWQYDEAYLLLEPNDMLQDMDSVKIIWEDTVRNTKGYYMLANGNKADHYRVATGIYNSIQDGQQLYILGKDNQKQKFLQKRTNREAFRKTLFDYYRLVDLM